MATVPTPTSATVGQKVTAAFWNQEIGVPFTYLLTPPLFLATCTNGDTWSGSARVTGPTSITGSGQSIWFDTEIRDADLMHDPTTRGDVITIKTAGVWEVVCLASFAANAAATARYLNVNITPSGGSVSTLSPAASMIVPGNTSNSAVSGAMFSYPFGVNDTIQFNPITATVLNFTGARVSMRWVSK